MLKKLIIILKNVRNWYLIPFDKIFGGGNILYKFRNNILVECRTKSCDINEAVVVLSGDEYPVPYLKFNSSIKPTIFDLGGNIGAFSLLFDYINKDLDYEGFVFEPHPGNFDLLKRNLKN
jgi:hypothetical protein